MVQDQQDEDHSGSGDVGPAFRGFLDLPFDTLSAIFEDACGPPSFETRRDSEELRARLRQAVRFSHIARAARTTAINDGRLWNWIYMEMPTDAREECLARAAGSTLHIHANGYTEHSIELETTFQQFLEATIAHADRWESLVVSLQSTNMLRILLDMTRSKSFPLLAHLEVVDFTIAGEQGEQVEEGRGYFITDFGRQNGIEELDIDAPALRVLRCANIFPGPDCGSADTVIASHISSDHRRQFEIPLDILSQFTTMDFGNQVYANLVIRSDSPISLPRPLVITLPRLAELHTGIDIMHDHRIFTHWRTFTKIRMPNLTSLWLDLPAFEPDEWAIMVTALSAMPRLHTLSLYGARIDMPSVFNRRVLPVLQTIEVNAMYIPNTCDQGDPWPELPVTCRKIHIVGCWDRTLRYYVTPALLHALLRSEETWTAFEEILFERCHGDYEQESFRAFLDERVGRAVSQKVRCVD